MLEIIFFCEQERVPQRRGHDDKAYLKRRGKHWMGLSETDYTDSNRVLRNSLESLFPLGYNEVDFGIPKGIGRIFSHQDIF